jgi:hypothetical protein
MNGRRHSTPYSRNSSPPSHRREPNVLGRYSPAMQTATTDSPAMQTATQATCRGRISSLSRPRLNGRQQPGRAVNPGQRPTQQCPPSGEPIGALAHWPARPAQSSTVTIFSPVLLSSTRVKLPSSMKAAASGSFFRCASKWPRIAMRHRSFVGAAGASSE